MKFTRGRVQKKINSKNYDSYSLTLYKTVIIGLF